MNTETLLISGATGNVGGDTIRALLARLQGAPEDHRVDIRAGLRRPASLPTFDGPLGDGPVEAVRLDFTDPETFAPALAGVDRALLVRPPQLADVPRYFGPFVEAAEQAGVRHMVFLSVMGAESVSFIPQAKIEALLRGSRLHRTFLRPGFFHQNLSTTHAAEIRDENRIAVPAGGGKTSFVDTRDIGEIAARCLTESGHEEQSYSLSGGELLDYYEVAEILSEVLGRQITYTRPGALRFLFKELRHGTPLAFALTMVGIYMPTRLGRAARSDGTLKRLLGHEPRSFRSFVREHREVWDPAADGS